MKHITVGVAGHVDHGKTALVRALTGIETDRLPEERERGMSIALGFAHLAVPDGEIDLIDVPGHEKFVKTMIAGATGIDAVLLVVAATERVMPQTVEHMALCSLLGVNKGLVVVSKSDLVPAAERRQAEDEVRSFVRGTFLASSPVLFVSAVTGEGIDELRRHLSELLAQSEPQKTRSGFSLPIDRVFTMPGHGTVVTGTLRRGVIRAANTVELMPSGGRAVVRALHVHGEPAGEAAPGRRVAVNLRGVSKSQVAKGDILASPGLLAPTRLLDSELALLPSDSRLPRERAKPLRHGDTLRIAWGTREALARLHLLDRDEIHTGETALVQFRFGEPQAASMGERFVARTESPIETIGGGRFIDIAPGRHTRHDSAAMARLRALAYGTPSEKIMAKLAEAGIAGREIDRLLTELDIELEEWDEVQPCLPVVACGGLIVQQASFQQACEMLLDQIGRFHQARPTERGMGQEELRMLLPRQMAPAVFHQALAALQEEARVEIEGGLARLAGYSPESALTAVERQIIERMEQQFARAGLAPPDPATVIGQDRRRKVLFRYLVDQEALVSITDSGSGRAVTFHAEAIRQAACLLTERLIRGQGYTVSELNAILSISRKYGVPLFEYLDGRGVTRRVGDLRFLREAPTPTPIPSPAPQERGEHPRQAHWRKQI